LKDAVLTHCGKKWGAIAALVPGRTKAQCYGRWRDILNPGIALEAGRTGKWAEHEVTKLKDAVLTHGDKNWKGIAALVPGRTKKQCCKKWGDIKLIVAQFGRNHRLKKVPACGQDPHSP
jgi:hypothetical protein